VEAKGDGGEEGGGEEVEWNEGRLQYFCVRYVM